MLYPYAVIWGVVGHDPPTEKLSITDDFVSLKSQQFLEILFHYIGK